MEDLTFDPAECASMHPSVALSLFYRSFCCLLQLIRLTRRKEPTYRV